MNLVLKKIRNLTRDTKFEGRIYVVGGFVRDLILKRNSYDIDILVNLPEGGIKLANFLYEKKMVTRPVLFPKYGTAQVQCFGYQLEFVMCRQENYRKGSRKPKVASASLQADIRRRDFTINTLLLDIKTGQILDLTGQAKADLEAKKIRAANQPAEIFREDPLRLLRAIRFAVQLNFAIEENTYDAICQQAKQLKNISWERKRDEISKIVLSAQSARGLQMLYATNLLKFVIPELLPTVNCAQNIFHYQDVWQHTLQVLKNTKPIAQLRWAALLHDIGKPVVKSKENGEIHFYNHEEKSAEIAANILRRLKFSKKFIKEVVFLIKNHLRTQNYGDESEVVSDKKIRKLVHESGELLDNLLQLIHADNLAKKEPKPNQIPNLQKRIEKLQFPVENKPPVDGQDIMTAFELKSGKKVGELLGLAKKIWLEHPDWQKAQILAEIKKRSDSSGT